MNTEQLLQELVDRLVLAARDQIESVVLFGSAARNEFSRQYSDLNVLCIVSSLAPAEMATLAPVVRWWTEDNHQRPPLFWTAAELAQAADVFPIELLDIKESHRILSGKDVLTGIHVPLNLHRVEVERELRISLLKLRQQYLIANSDKKGLAAVLAKSATSIRTLLRHTLLVCGEPAPHDREHLLTRISEVFRVDVSGVRKALLFRESAPSEPELESAYAAYLQALGAIIEQIDHFVPKSEWQRVQTQR